MSGPKTKREISDYLRSKNITPTAQRVEMASVLLAKPQHLTAEEIYQMINEEFEVASRATIYNNLHLFVNVGLLKTLNVSPTLCVYDSNLNEHFHIIDQQTGEIFDIDMEPGLLDELVQKMEIAAEEKNKMKYRLNFKQLVFRGMKNS